MEINCNSRSKTLEKMTKFTTFILKYFHYYALKAESYLLAILTVLQKNCIHIKHCYRF
jgi:hypothetical protein